MCPILLMLQAVLSCEGLECKQSCRCLMPWVESGKQETHSFAWDVWKKHLLPVFI